MKLRYIILAVGLVFLGFWWSDRVHKSEWKKTVAAIDSLQSQLKECKLLLALADGQLCKTSYYGDKHQGRRTASGAIFDKNLPMCASWDFPLGTVVSVMNLKNGKVTYGMVLDRGPDVPEDPMRRLDVSEKMASDLGMLHTGVVPVLVKRCDARLCGSIDTKKIYYKKVRKAVDQTWLCQR